jgi:hypothetical protein
METIINYIKEKRPNITKSSLKTYESILRNLYNKIFDDEDYDMTKFGKEVNKVIKFLKDMEPKKRKTILSALVVITDNKEYRELMLDDIKEYNKEEAKQTKSKSVNENWVEQDELLSLYNELKKEYKILYVKKNKKSNEYQRMQDFIILSLLGGFYIPPRRSKDYVNFKIKNIDKDKDNYIEKNELVFNSYKTAKTYGQQKIVVPTPLKTIINKWSKINPTDYLLFDSEYKQMNNVKLNQRLNKLFDKKASVNALRKSYLSDKFGDMIDLKNELDKTMNDMGSSRSVENIYIKK